MSTENQIVPFKDWQKYEEERKRLYDFVTKASDIPTPRKHVRKRPDGFFYPEYEYMLDLMNQFHPVRSETLLHPITLNEKTMCYEADVIVKDLITGEERSGSECHPVPAYEAGSSVMKDLKTIRELLGNAKKSALTEALRNAYSRFGIAADIYKKTLKKESTEEQQQRFAILIAEAESLQSTEGITPQQKQKLEDWTLDLRDKWTMQNKNSAAEFLDNLDKSIIATKLKLKENSNGGAEAEVKA